MDESDVLPPGLEAVNADIPEDLDQNLDDDENLYGVAEVMESEEVAPTEETNGVNDAGSDAESDKDDESKDPFADFEDSDEEGGGVQVTIRKLEPAEKPAANRQGKLDLDTTPMINDKPIYDLDLAQMEDRPWRKPGADLTDYFNYGFSEETWNIYCERQKKLRIEFNGNQQQANKALLSNIVMANPLANPIIVPQQSQGSVVKILTDNGGRFKPNNYNASNDNVIRTVISSGNVPNIQTPMIDFSKPPPMMTIPTMNLVGPPPLSQPSHQSDAPPGIDIKMDRPPGVMSPTPSSGGPPGVSMNLSTGLDLSLNVPPPGFNPSLPPPGMPPGMGLMNTNLPPPGGFNIPPPNFARAGFNNPPAGIPSAGGRNMMVSGYGRESNDYDEDGERRSRRKRSRSRSPDRRNERDSRRRTDRTSDRTSTRRHRSRSSSGDRRRHRDDRDRRDRRDDDDRRRDRRDDEDRNRKSRTKRDDDDDRRDRKDKRSRHDDEDATNDSL